MKNRLIDLNNHLFLALERLNDDELTTEQIQAEIARSQAVSKIGDTIIDIAKVALVAEKMKADAIIADAALPTYFDVTPIQPLITEKSNAN